MHNLRVRAGEEWALAGTFLSELNSALNEKLTRALFYHTIVPVLEEQGGTKKDGRYLFVRSDLLEPWQRYAAYRARMVSSGIWIARRKWSTDDFNLANGTVPAAMIAPETTTAVAV